MARAQKRAEKDAARKALAMRIVEMREAGSGVDDTCDALGVRSHMQYYRLLDYIKYDYRGNDYRPLAKRYGEVDDPVPIIPRVANPDALAGNAGNAPEIIGGVNMNDRVQLDLDGLQQRVNRLRYV